MALPAPNFVKFEKVQQHYVQISSKEFHLNRAINVGSKDRNVFNTEEKNGFSLHGFSRNSQLLNDIPSRSLSNINETGRGRNKLQEDIQHSL